MMSNALSFHSRAHTSLTHVNGPYALFPRFNDHFLFTNRTIKVNEEIEFSLSNMSTSTIVVTFSLTDYDPEDILKLNLSDVQKLQLADDISSNSLFTRTILIDKIINHKVSFVYNSEGKVTRKEGAHCEEVGIVDVSVPLWGLIYYYETGENSGLCHISISQKIFVTTPPLTFTGHFHAICGKNISLSLNRKTATCISNNLDQKFLFSSTPIKPNEIIELKFQKIYHDEPFGFGFTTLNPDYIQHPLDFHSLNQESIFWSHNISIPRTNTVMSFSYNEYGDISYTLNGYTTRCTRGKIDTGDQLWALMYLRGQNASVVLSYRNEQPQVVEEGRQEQTFSVLRYQSHDIKYEPMNHSISTRRPENGPWQVWFFAEQPIRLKQRVAVLIQTTPEYTQNNLLLGLTCCNPQHILWDDVPSHSQLRDNTATNWFKIIALPVNRDNRGDELCFFLAENNVLRLRKNHEDTQIVNLPPMGTQIWAFVKLTGDETVNLKIFQGQLNERFVSDETPFPSREDGAWGFSEIDIEEEIAEELPQLQLPQPLPTSSRVAVAEYKKPTYRRLQPMKCFVKDASAFSSPQSWVFSEKPIRIGQRIVLQILSNPHNLRDNILVGFTWIDPENLDWEQYPDPPFVPLIPDDSHWTRIVNLGSDYYCKGDELECFITMSSVFYRLNEEELQIKVNPASFMENYWPFCKINGDNVKVKFYVVGR